MPRRDDLERIVILGSGPIRIGQAAEFDFSGSQACRALRDDGYEVILINSNPATIQNDPEMADRIYIEPLLPEVVKRILEIEKPDAILLYGDTNSCLSAIVAKRRKVPLFHMEAGNRSFDERVPEEINRRIVDHISDINMPLTEHARRYLIQEGIKPETIIKTGSCMEEVLEYYDERIN